MEPNTPSFFDVSGEKGKQAFSKIKNGSIKDLSALQQQEKVILSETFMKTSKKQGKKKERFLMLTENKLYIAKSFKKQKIYGEMNLKETKCSWLKTSNPQSIFHGLQCQGLYGFRLTHRSVSIYFYTTDVEVFKNWKQKMYRSVIQEQFHEEFSVSKMIGKGSFAKVYFAIKNETKQAYAIKAFNKEFMREQHKGVESIKNEIKIMYSLNNPYLIHLYEVFETQNSIYFVVDILSGGELIQNIKNDQKFNTLQIQTVMKNLLIALDHLHSKGIMHRDLKPENILIRTKNKYDIVVADFGLATTYDNPDTILFKRCGTPGFVAPEILVYDENQPFYDSKCDIFSAGVIMYILITGKQPFIGDDYKQILRANKNCEVDFEKESLQQIHPIGIDLLKKILVADPLQRFSAKQALEHQFFSLTEAQIQYYQNQQNKQNLRQNLQHYQKEFNQALRQRTASQQNPSSKDSLALKTISRPAFNGNTDTVGSIKMNSNGKLDSKNSLDSSKQRQQQQLKQSKFGTLGPQQQNPSQSPQKPKKAKKERVSKCMHKLAIKNNLYRQQQEEQKNEEDHSDDEEEGDDDNNANGFNESEYSISDEDSENSVQKQMVKMNFDQYINMNKVPRAGTLSNNSPNRDDLIESPNQNEEGTVRDRVQSCQNPADRFKFEQYRKNSQDL